MKADPCPLIAHIIHRLDTGGLENGLVNLINHMPARYRHAVICLTDYTAFRERIQSAEVAVYALHKKPGQDWGIYVKLWRLLRQLRPAIVHTRNLATLESQLPAALAGVKVRLHGEHGWDANDPDGSRYLWLRRLLRPLVAHYIPLSQESEIYLRERVGVAPGRITRICNGVDSDRFQPAANGRAELPVPGFAPVDSAAAPGAAAPAIVIGTVGRMQAIKDQLTLAQAFVQLVRTTPAGPRLRLALIGEGPLRADIAALLEQAGVMAQVWLPGARNDVPALLPALDIFVLPSRGEGISNTILEAMACGLPVVATRVGGNSELLVDGETGVLVAPGDPTALAAAIRGYVDDPDRRQAHGSAARQRIEQHFSIHSMVAAYTALYDAVLHRPTVAAVADAQS